MKRFFQPDRVWRTKVLDNPHDFFLIPSSEDAGGAAGGSCAEWVAGVQTVDGVKGQSEEANGESRIGISADAIEIEKWDDRGGSVEPRRLEKERADIRTAKAVSAGGGHANNGEKRRVEKVIGNLTVK